VKRRLLPWLLLPAGVTALVLAAPLGLRHVDAFLVQRVEISGSLLLPPHEVLAATGASARSNLWEDLSTWETRLTAHPVIREARVERQLPGTLRVRVREFAPLALAGDGELVVLTEEGVALPVDPSRASVDLPLLRGEPGDSAGLAALAEYGRISGLSPSLASRVSEFGAAPGGLRLLSTEPYVEILIPPGAGPQRLRQLEAVLADLHRREKEPRAARAPYRVDLRFAEQVVVRPPPSE
jgi:cell division septal protein FtsQ